MRGNLEKKAIRFVEYPVKSLILDKLFVFLHKIVCEIVKYTYVSHNIVWNIDSTIILGIPKR